MMPKRLIYIVDDEPTITDPLAYALVTDGFEVESFINGQNFQQCFEEKKPDLIVLDVGLPDINGFDLFRTIKEFSDIPVLFLTARRDEIDRIVGLELGADDYVVKPFSPREVAARIRVIIKRYSAPVLTDSKDAPLVINQDSATACYFGTVLTLTKFEWLILLQLAKQPKKVYSRNHLLNSIWPNQSGSMERTVDTHIKTLRSKLKEVRNGVDPIKTHRGLGYSLDIAHS